MSKRGVSNSVLHGRLKSNSKKFLIAIQLPTAPTQPCSAQALVGRPFPQELGEENCKLSSLSRLFRQNRFATCREPFKRHPVRAVVAELVDAQR
jgi:hypothetical protein